MIQIDSDGPLMTPKNFVKEVLRRDLEILTECWEERFEGEMDEMTERERGLVRDQMEKMEQRIIRTCGL